MKPESKKQCTIPDTKRLFKAKVIFRTAQTISIICFFGIFMMMILFSSRILLALDLLAIGLIVFAMWYLRSRILAHVREDAINMVLIIRDWMRVCCPHISKKDKDQDRAFFHEPETVEDYYLIISESWRIAYLHYDGSIKGNAENDGYGIILKFIPPKSFIDIT
jgi:hypothetical protein